MKIYVMTDLEGVTGVHSSRQSKPAETREYLEATRLLMADVAALAEGLQQAGATEIWAFDGHGGGGNFRAEGMVSGVKYVAGGGAVSNPRRDV